MNNEHDLSGSSAGGGFDLDKVYRSIMIVSGFRLRMHTPDGPSCRPSTPVAGHGQSCRPLIQVF